MKQFCCVCGAPIIKKKCSDCPTHFKPRVPFIKNWFISGTIIKKNDMTEYIPKTHVQATTASKAIKMVEKQYNGILRNMLVEGGSIE
jgi:hypothetical protein